jgi:hypothetical protein
LREKHLLPPKNYHKILGLSPGASTKQIKSAYRKLALKYHPDRNSSSTSKQKFQEITEAYNSLLENPGQGGPEASSYDDRAATEVMRRERERMQAQARARREKKRKEEDYFKSPEWQDAILFLKYTGNILVLLFGLLAIILPALLAIFSDPASLAGTFFFILIGTVILIYIYQHRKGWFRLGKFNRSLKDLLLTFRIQAGKPTRDKCCYCRSTMADGKAYKIELLKTIDIKIQTYGALNHDARYKNKNKRVVVPRSARAQFFHRMASLIKVFSILIGLLLFPVDSILWRLLAGIFAGGMLSFVLLKLVRVKSKVNYLFTPGLLIKTAIWLLCLSLISTFGPGFNISISSYVYLVVAGLLFFLDMIFDLVMGIFPFYRSLFRPLIRQGAILDSLYKDGYQNYQELPVYSVIYPLFRWIF